MRRTLAAILIALALAGLTAPQADARRAARTVTFQLTADATLAPYADQVAAIWTASGTGVEVVVVADCAGAHCIHGVIEDSAHLGLTWRTDDGSHLATVSSAVGMYGSEAILDTFAHEVGHGVIDSLGGGMWHASNERDLMSASHYPGDPLRRITRETKTYLAPLC